MYSGRRASSWFALHEEIAEPRFAEVERGWAQHFAGRSASTEDFIAFVNQVARRDLTRFLRDWLYGTTVPPMPNHPDWVADPGRGGSPTDRPDTSRR